MRTKFDTEAALARAAADFSARFARGSSAPRPLVSAECRAFAAATDRPSVLAAADAFCAALAAAGHPCTKDLALEAAAAFFGTANWDRLSAMLPRPRKARPAAEIAQVADDWVASPPRLGTWRGESGICWTLWHPQDCRPAARRVVVMLARSGTPAAEARLAVVEGADGQRVLERVTVAGGRKEASWHAAEMAARWLEPPAADTAPEERAAAAMLRDAGFDTNGYGGGTDGWDLAWEDGVSGRWVYRITDASGASCRFGTGEPVLLGTYEPDPDDDGEVVEMPDVAAALEAVRRSVESGERPAQQPSRRL